MSVFQPCFDFTIRQEGKMLEETPGDTGGMTFWGIARNPNPGWPGWALVDAHIKVADDFKAAGDLCNQDESLIALVMGFYQQTFNGLNLAGLNNQELAIQVFDKNFNMGGIAVKIFQLLVGADPDGNIGPNTLMRANSTVDQSGLVDRFLEWAKAHYMDLVARHPEDLKFLGDWESRCVRSDKI